MKVETEALLQQCRTALLQQSNECLAALLAQWFELMIGDEDMDEELDDLCLLLDYHVQSWGAQTSYATYTSWWEVEGYLEPSEGMFICADVAALRQHLLDMSIKQFDLVIELAYQARSMMAELEGEPHLPTGHALLREMAVWLAGAVPESERADQRRLPQVYTRVESKEQRRKREQERIAQSSQQGYLVVSPDTSQEVMGAFRRWCKEHVHPYIWIEPKGRQLATLRAQTKNVVAREASAVLARFQEQLPELAGPYIANAQARSYQACLARPFRHQVVLEGILAEDAESAAREMVALWSAIMAEEKQRAVEQEMLRLAALEPMWSRTLKRLHEQGQQLELSVPMEQMVLPAQWDALFTREQLSAFLAFLELPARSRESKATLAQRVQERLETDQTVRTQFFEVFKRELAIPPWELETLLDCTPTERKRWTEEGKLPVLDRRSFRKAGSQMEYPVFDRRVILGLPRAEIDLWRVEYQALVKEHRKKGARAAAARRKDLSRSS
ncbi:MAG TPA: hypothetical protein VFA10_28315 [Ktedonobacteraceae bacterium]|nr:hypothetical protein [Ktedonobacteraceae bacterium]